MSFDLNMGSSGDASADMPSVDTTSVDANVSEGAATPDVSQVFDSGSNDAPADPSLTTQPTEATSNDQTPPNAVDQAPVSDEEAEEKALQAAANDPNTPRWAREQIQRSLAYSAKLKERATEAQTMAEQLKAQYEGMEAAPPEQLQNWRQNDELLYPLQSLTATPDQRHEALSRVMPQGAFEEYQSYLAWNALAKPDGTPDYDNLQAVVDKFSGQPGAVKAKDVLLAVEALAQNRLDPEDLHGFATVEEYEAYQRQQAITQDLEAKQAALDENAKFQEAQIRQSEIGQAMGHLQSQADARIMATLEKFKLTPVPNEPKPATDFKNLVNDRIRHIIATAPNEIRELAEITKAVEMLGKPGKKPIDAQSAVNQVRSFFSTSQYQQFANKGLSELTSRIEKEVSQMAYFYKLAMQGLEAENTRAQNTRPVIGQPSVANGLPQLTADDIARMTAAERAEHSALSLTNALRQGGISRLG